MKHWSIVVMSIVVAALVVPAGAEAQSAMAGDEMFIEMLRHDIRQARTEVMTSVMELSAEDAAVFWPIYNDYRKKVSDLVDGELDIINEYAGAYWSLTNPQASEMAGKFFDIERQRLSHLESFYKELAKALSPVQAMKAAQLEYRMDLVMDMQIANELPMVE